MENGLIAALREGSEEALCEIVDKFSGYVCTVLRNFSGGALSSQDIEELCSDVFYSLWKHRANLEAEMGLRAYLSVCAKNAVKNRLRSLKPSSEDIDEAEITSGLSIERTAELNDMMRELQKALETLGGDEREIFLRYFFYGEKTSVIANAMRLNENTARSKLYRARNKLKEYLESRGYDYV